MANAHNQGGPEIIESDQVLTRANVNWVQTELLKVRASIWIAVASLVIAVAVLVFSIIYLEKDLLTWATGLISAIAGAAISYGFNARGRASED